MHKRKFILIGIISILVIALVAVFAVPAVAAGFPWGPKAGVNKNVTVVQGTIASLTSTSITITEAGGTSVTLALDSSTNFNIHGTDWIGSADLTGKTVTAVYKNGQTGTPVASQVMINMPEAAPGIANFPAIKNFASVKGTLTVAGNTLTITPDPSFTQTWNETEPAVTILYNSSTGAIQGLMVNRPGQPPFTPKNPNNKFATVQGTIEVSNSSPAIIITPNTAPSKNLTAPSNNAVTILYDSSTDTIQGFMMHRPGQGFGKPGNLPNQNGHFRHGGPGV
jgi:hypothetical protein